MLGQGARLTGRGLARTLPGGGRNFARSGLELGRDQAAHARLVSERGGPARCAGERFLIGGDGVGVTTEPGQHLRLIEPASGGVELCKGVGRGLPLLCACVRCATPQRIVEMGGGALGRIAFQPPASLLVGGQPVVDEALTQRG